MTLLDYGGKLHMIDAAGMEIQLLLSAFKNADCEAIKNIVSYQESVIINTRKAFWIYELLYEG